MRSTSTTGDTVPPPVLTLDETAALDPAIVGAKASALAVAKRSGLPVLDGFVIPVGVTAEVAAAARGTSLAQPLAEALRRSWQELARGDPVVVRSSSPLEDGSTSSMAGRFRSVLDVRGWSQLLAAVDEVVASADGGPMAVLVQPLVAPAFGGVLFGADPVTGRTDRLVVSAVPGGPHRLVSGEVDGTQLTLSPRGRLLDDGAPRHRRGDRARCAGSDSGADGRCAARRTRRRLARLARDAARVFGGPQDIEWALLDDGRLLLLQSRPITTLGDELRAQGPVFGPGPVAETFPAPLATLEDDLWIPPLREGLRRALALTGAVSRRRLRASPVVVTVHGRPAADLDLLGLAPRRRSVWRALDPRGPARRLGAAWRVGRLRAALSGLATDVIATVDAHLAEVPALDTLAPGDLLHLLDRAGDELISLHGYEILAGQLLEVNTESPTGASAALRALAVARADDPDAGDDELTARDPVLLALVPPAIAPDRPLPSTPTLLDRRRPPAPSDRVAGAGRVDPAIVREALRLRIRWVHELMARAALALGTQLSRRGALATAADIRHLPLADLRHAVTGRTPMTAVRPRRVAAPLPSAFRLAGDDVVVPVVQESGSAGQGAGGGRGSGPVRTRPGHGDTDPAGPAGRAGPAGGVDAVGHVADPVGRVDVPDGAVLVVPTLDPSLATLLPRLGGLVAETGSVLSHLAILAREYGVPTVVGLPGATRRFSEGTWVVVDGSTGQVESLGDEEWRAA